MFPNNPHASPLHLTHFLAVRTPRQTNRLLVYLLPSILFLPPFFSHIMSANNDGSAQKVAMLTGITGQDGSYLAELLLSKNYVVYGMIRRSSSFNTGRLEHLRNNQNLKLRYGDILDSCNITNLLAMIDREHPGLPRLEIYHLCAQSHVAVSFQLPEYTGVFMFHKGGWGGGEGCGIYFDEGAAGLWLRRCSGLSRVLSIAMCYDGFKGSP